MYALGTYRQALCHLTVGKLGRVLHLVRDPERHALRVASGRDGAPLVTLSLDPLGVVHLVVAPGVIVHHTPGGPDETVEAPTAPALGARR